MHRSGTSAVAAALEAMGLQAGRPEDRLAADLMNPGGYFEIAQVNDLNQEILHHLGANWDAPPHLAEGWTADPDIDPFIHRCRHLVTSTLGDDFVLKDPRISLLLPLWRRVLVDRCCAVMIVRDPVEVAWSLALRDGLQILTGLALWGAYNRSALEGLAGLPVHVLRYEDLVEQPRATLTAMAAAVEDFGQLAPGADVAAGVTVVPARAATQYLAPAPDRTSSRYRPTCASWTRRSEAPGIERTVRGRRSGPGLVGAVAARGTSDRRRPPAGVVRFCAPPREPTGRVGRGPAPGGRGRPAPPR